MVKVNFLDYEEYTLNFILREKTTMQNKYLCTWTGPKYNIFKNISMKYKGMKFHWAKASTFKTASSEHCSEKQMHEQTLKNTFKCTNRNLTYQLNLPKCPSTDHLHHFIIFSFHAQISHFIYCVFIYTEQNSHFIYRQLK